MEQNAYVTEGGNEGGRGATPTSISTFDFFAMMNNPDVDRLNIYKRKL